MAYSKSQADLKIDLADQISFLRASSRAYDKGEIVEGKRLALALRILLFDGKGRSKAVALLTRLSLTHRLKYHSVVMEINESTTRRFYSFCLSSSEGEVYCKPNLSSVQIKLPFENWWNQVLLKNYDLKVTRGNIIMSIADQDGGAHVDAELEGNYGTLAKLNGSGIRFDALSGLLVNAPDGKPYEGRFELVLIRQIAHELLSTFDEQLNMLV